VNLIFFETSGSTALILILTFGLGVLVGLLSTLPKQLRARSKLKELQQKQGSESTSSSPMASSKSSSGSSPSSGKTGMAD
jgi:putative membrane protein